MKEEVYSNEISGGHQGEVMPVEQILDQIISRYKMNPRNMATKILIKV